MAYLKLFRFPLVFTAIADSATGYFLVVGDLKSVKGWTVVCLALSSACLYSFGMAMNDVADRERDRTLAPTRTLPSGRISVRSALIANVGLLIISVAGISFASDTNYQLFLFWTLIVVGIITYDFWIKIPPVMGFIRSANLTLGISAAGPFEWHDVWISFLAVSLPHFLYVTALTYVSTLEDTAMRKSRVWIGAGLMVVAAFLAAHWVRLLFGSIFLTMHVTREPVRGFINLFKITDLREVPALGTAVLLSFWILYRASKARDRRGVMLIVRDGVAGIIVLNATLLLAWHLWIPALIVSALIIPAAASVALFKRLA